MSEAATPLRRPARPDIGHILLRTTKLTEEQLEAARLEQAEQGGTLTDRLVAAGAVSADEVMTALSEQLGLPIRAQIKAADVDLGLVERVPIAFAKDHGVEIWVEVHGDQTKIPARMRKIMDVCSHPAVGLTWNSNDTDVEDGSVAKSFALLRPDIRCCHITDLRSSYPYRELFALLSGSGFTGFTLCEFPDPVPASNGAPWLRDYRERWEALQRA